MKIRVTITKEHIKEAKKLIAKGSENRNWCPIALALREKFPSVYDINVFTGHVSVEEKRFKLSNNAVKFVKNFDLNKKVQPSTFYLEKI